MPATRRLVTLLALVLLATVTAGPLAPAPAGAARAHHARAHADQHRTTRVAFRAAPKTHRQTHRQGHRQTHRHSHRHGHHRGTFGALPVLSYRGAADPSVLRWGGGYVAVSTGPAAPRATAPAPGGPWTNVPSALLVLPSWAIDSRAWASDLDYVDGVYLLYFSVPVAGLPTDGRCIGVATATDPTQTFVPDERPLVCPKQAVAPKALDRLKHKGRGLPVNGVIDPELFTDKGGKRYLLYRTEGVPSSIRITPLPDSGRAEGSTVRSTELVRSNGVIENPTMLVKHGQYVLLTSEGYFTGCGYTTTYRTSTSLLDWTGARSHLLLSQHKTGLCGPGGADVGVTPSGAPVLFFHAWTCPELGGANCPPGPDYDLTGAYGAQRSMFALTLRWNSNYAPRIRGYVAPIAAPPPPPPPPPPARANQHPDKDFAPAR